MVDADVSLGASLEVRHSANQELLGEFISRHASSQNLKSEVVLRRSSSLEFPLEFTSRQAGSQNLLGSFIVQQTAAGNNLGGEFTVQHATILNLHGTFEVNNVANLACGFVVLQTSWCAVCGGTGYVNPTCPYCHGSGWNPAILNPERHTHPVTPHWYYELGGKGEDCWFEVADDGWPIDELGRARPTVQDAWTQWNLWSLGVPPNSVVTIYCSIPGRLEAEGGTSSIIGVREPGSSLERKKALYHPVRTGTFNDEGSEDPPNPRPKYDSRHVSERAYEEGFVLHTNVNVGGYIEYYAQTDSRARFYIVGYWEPGVKWVELWGDTSVDADVWQQNFGWGEAPGSPPGGGGYDIEKYYVRDVPANRMFEVLLNYLKEASLMRTYPFYPNQAYGIDYEETSWGHFYAPNPPPLTSISRGNAAGQWTNHIGTWVSQTDKGKFVHHCAYRGNDVDDMSPIVTGYWDHDNWHYIEDQDWWSHPITGWVTRRYWRDHMVDNLTPRPLPYHRVPPSVTAGAIFLHVGIGGHNKEPWRSWTRGTVSSLHEHGTTFTPQAGARGWGSRQHRTIGHTSKNEDEGGRYLPFWVTPYRHDNGEDYYQAYTSFSAFTEMQEPDKDFFPLVSVLGRLFVDEEKHVPELKCGFTVSHYRTPNRIQDDTWGALLCIDPNGVRAEGAKGPHYFLMDTMIIKPGLTDRSGFFVANINDNANAESGGPRQYDMLLFDPEDPWIRDNDEFWVGVQYGKNLPVESGLINTWNLDPDRPDEGRYWLMGGYITRRHYQREWDGRVTAFIEGTDYMELWKKTPIGTQDFPLTFGQIRVWDDPIHQWFIQERGGIWMRNTAFIDIRGHPIFAEDPIMLFSAQRPDLDLECEITWQGEFNLSTRPETPSDGSWMNRHIPLLRAVNNGCHRLHRFTEFQHESATLFPTSAGVQPPLYPSSTGWTGWNPYGTIGTSAGGIGESDDPSTNKFWIKNYILTNAFDLMNEVCGHIGYEWTILPNPMGTTPSERRALCVFPRDSGLRPPQDLGYGTSSLSIEDIKDDNARRAIKIVSSGDLTEFHTNLLFTGEVSTYPANRNFWMNSAWWPDAEEKSRRYHLFSNPLPPNAAGTADGRWGDLTLVQDDEGYPAVNFQRQGNNRFYNVLQWAQLDHHEGYKSDKMGMRIDLREWRRLRFKFRHATRSGSGTTYKVKIHTRHGGFSNDNRLGAHLEYEFGQGTQEALGVSEHDTISDNNWTEIDLQLPDVDYDSSDAYKAVSNYYGWTGGPDENHFNATRIDFVSFEIECNETEPGTTYGSQKWLARRPLTSSLSQGQAEFSIANPKNYFFHGPYYPSHSGEVIFKEDLQCVVGGSPPNIGGNAETVSIYAIGGNYAGDNIRTRFPASLTRSGYLYIPSGYSWSISQVRFERPRLLDNVVDLSGAWAGLNNPKRYKVVDRSALYFDVETLAEARALIFGKSDLENKYFELVIDGNPEWNVGIVTSVGALVSPFSNTSGDQLIEEAEHVLEDGDYEIKIRGSNEASMGRYPLDIDKVQSDQITQYLQNLIRRKR